VASFPGTHAPLEVFLDVEVKARLEFRVEPTLAVLFAEQTSEAEQE
jgi:hypothetical protein